MILDLWAVLLCFLFLLFASSFCFCSRTHARTRSTALTPSPPPRPLVLSLCCCCAQLSLCCSRSSLLWSFCGEEVLLSQRCSAPVITTNSSMSLDCCSRKCTPQSPLHRVTSRLRFLSFARYGATCLVTRCLFCVLLLCACVCSFFASVILSVSPHSWLTTHHHCTLLVMFSIGFHCPRQD